MPAITATAVAQKNTRAVRLPRVLLSQSCAKASPVTLAESARTATNLSVDENTNPAARIKGRKTTSATTRRKSRSGLPGGHATPVIAVLRARSWRRLETDRIQLRHKQIAAHGARLSLRPTTEDRRLFDL